MVHLLGKKEGTQRDRWSYKGEPDKTAYGFFEFRRGGGGKNVVAWVMVRGGVEEKRRLTSWGKAG